MRCDVRTFPPHTAAVSEGESREPSGNLTTRRIIMTFRRSLRKVLTGDGYQAPCIERDIHVEHGTHAIDDSGVHDGDGGI